MLLKMIRKDIKGTVERHGLDCIYLSVNVIGIYDFSGHYDRPRQLQTSF